jgi:hypothetical protein
MTCFSRKRLLGRFLVPCLAALGLAGTIGCGVQQAPASLTVVKATDLGTIPTDPDIPGRNGGYNRSP